ncbi:MAG: chemotaxis protein CheC [Candidatus Omnitrophica bacterium]|nr:chemotaxis protein CheC [Candidatus Omnitrophota bacterium]
MSNGKSVDRALELIAKLSIDKASQVFSKMIKAGARIDLEKVYVADISEASAKVVSEGEEEIVGAFIDLVGDAPFKFLFFINKDDSLVVTDMILRREIGTTKEFNAYSHSAVQEIGNILASAISNVFATDFQIAMKPTPPEVIHDFAGTVFEEYIMGVALEKNEILIIESVFHVVSQDIRCRMFILPMPETEKVLNYIVSTM